MTRRELLKTAALAAVSLPRSLASPSSNPARIYVGPPLPRSYVWMRPSISRSTDDWKRDFDLLRASGIHGIIPEVYNGRQTLFRSKRLPVRAPWLESALPIARAAGLEVHAWMWCMPCLLDDVIKQHPDWYNVNAKGESAVDKPAYVDYYKFLDPARPEVREFVGDTVRELAAIAGLTGIHLDYIRHPDAILPRGLWSKYGIVQDKVYPPYDYGYTEYSRKIFKTQYGVDPIELKDPESSREWLQYRLDSVVDLVNNYLVPAAKAGKKQISAAVFPGPSLARTMVRQDWGRFKLDAFFPMLYHSFYEEGPEWVRRYTEEAVRTAPGSVHSGLFVSPMTDAEFTRTIELAMAGGAAGVSIFDFGAMNPARWALFSKVVAAR
jgi:uncharacterized lipoprotein YddW (UPF0748 family)